MKEVNWGGVRKGYVVGKNHWPVIHVELWNGKVFVTLKRVDGPGTHTTMLADDLKSLGVRVYRPALPEAPGAVIRLPDGQLYARMDNTLHPWLAVGHSHGEGGRPDEAVQELGFEVLFEGVTG